MAKIGSLLLAGLAAYGIYKYTKMSDQEKQDLMNKGKKLVNDNLGSIKDGFSSVKDGMQGANA